MGKGQPRCAGLSWAGPEVWEAPSRETKQGGGGVLWQDPRQRLVRLVLGQWQDREGGSTREQAGSPAWQWGLSEDSYSSNGGTSPDQPMQEGRTWELEVVGVAGTLAQSALYLRATLHRPRLTPSLGPIREPGWV